MKTKGNTPKYGLIYHSTFIGRAGLKNKGRISRYLANKCSIASRIDCFSGTILSIRCLFPFYCKFSKFFFFFLCTEETCDVFGLKLREQVEDRLKFYESGDIPRKNVDVMQEALAEAKTVLVGFKFSFLILHAMRCATYSCIGIPEEKKKKEEEYHTIG